MTDPQDIAAKAFEFIKKGHEFDLRQEFQMALQHYTKGMEHLQLALKHCKIETVKPLWRQKFTEVLERAEQLKGISRGPAGGAAPNQSGGQANAGHRPPGGTDDMQNKEDEAMIATLSGAIVMEKPDVKWDHVAGLEEAKRVLRDSTELPLEFPHLYAGESSLQPWKGILLYGPPGTGKTYLAKAVATNTGDSTTFLSISSANLVSKWVGESAKLVKTLFTLARQKAPTVVFVDEIDALTGKRGEGNKSESSSQLLTEFLTQMDGCGPSTEGILILGATNTPWDLDRAILSRFQKKIYIPLPDIKVRLSMLMIHLRNERMCLSEKELRTIALKTENFSARDLKALVQGGLQEVLFDFKAAQKWVKVKPHPTDPSLDFALMPYDKTSPKGEVISTNFERIRADSEMRKRSMLPSMMIEQLQRALERCKSSVSVADLKEFDEWTLKFGSEGV
eukprot:GEMP01005323.1.p1 GENE.GEMP01005323.1~~GEMP01005323.1.p1  ORF type:complete len:450 (+),score=103.71 GEMP01005323.1:167-1516(+)